MAYSDVQKAMAVELIRRNNHVLDDLTLAEIRRLLNAPNLSDRGVRNWLKESAAKKFTDKKDEAGEPLAVLDQVEQTIEESAAETLDQMFEDTARLYLKQSQKADVIGATKGKDAVIAAATAVDKMRLLRNLPTEIVAVLPNLLDAIDRRGLKASEVFGAMLEELARVDSD
jgi:hypothetical protein